jgi:hypothetical protein
MRRSCRLRIEEQLQIEEKKKDKQIENDCW